MTRIWTRAACRCCWWTCWKQLPSYGDAARAALEAAVREILTGVRQPVLLFEVAGDVRYAGTRRAARRLADATVAPRPADLAGRARRAAPVLRLTQRSGSWFQSWLRT